MNMPIIPQTICQRMSHREIAELTGKESFHVKRDCETMLKELGLDPKGYIQNWIHPQNGQTYIEYMLPRDLVETLITGYSIRLRHAVLNRLRELEAKVAQPLVTLPNFANPAEAARAWAEQFEAKQVAEKQIAVLEPKAQVMDVIADTVNTYSIRDSAKTIGIQESKLIDFMLKKHWVYRENSRHRRLCAYAQRVDQKVMVNKVSKVVACEDGDKVFTQARITAFGLTRLTALVAAAGLLNK